MQGVAATLHSSTARRLRIDYLPRVLLGTLLARGCVAPVHTHVTHDLSTRCLTQLPARIPVVVQLQLPR